MPPARAPDAAPATRAIVRDPLGRGIGYLRLSLTRRCAMRCSYCRPEIDANPADEQTLTPGEITRLVEHLVVRHGLRKVRLTGGDPTSRPDHVAIIAAIAGIDERLEVAMTTNGLTLAHRAPEYAAAGLRRVNISLDTLDRAQFAQLTGVDALPRVLDGIEAAAAAGLTPIRLNAVVVRGHNDDQLVDLAVFGVRRGIEVRFIELMPMGPLAARWSDRYVPMSVMRDRLRPGVARWSPLPQRSDSATRFHVELHDGLNGVVGFITPMSCNFCASCDRLRVGADGTVFPCLMDEPRGSLLPALRPVFDGDAVDTLLAQAYRHKQPEHPHDGFVTMTHIGG
jgi:cyclic pyranopterin phosphate synthase